MVWESLGSNVVMCRQPREAMPNTNVQIPTIFKNNHVLYLYYHTLTLIALLAINKWHIQKVSINDIFSMAKYNKM